MKRDFKTWILLLLFGMPIFFIIFIAAIYIGNCGFDNDCSNASLPPKIHTPIPTLIPATFPVPKQANLAREHTEVYGQSKDDLVRLGQCGIS